MSEVPEYIHDRVFNAPLAMVWRAWTDPDLLQRWYGPGVETVIHGYDLKPGGAWLNEMRFGEKSDFTKMAFQEVAPQEKLVWMTTSTDADWNEIANPMMPNWPRCFLTTVTFEAEDDITNVRLTMLPVNASEEEIDCWRGAMSGMDGGWGGGFKIIDEILSELSQAA